MTALNHISETHKNNYKMIVEDNANSTQKTSLAATKLISLDKVSAIITLFDPAANIVAPLASRF